MVDCCDSDTLEETLANDLVRRYGVLMRPDDLISVLGYPSAEAYQQAVTRKALPVPIFRLDRRRGHFALARDVACVLAKQRNAALACPADLPSD